MQCRASAERSDSCAATATADPAPKRIASVQVVLDTAVEQVNVPLTAPDSRLVEARMELPMGLILEKNERGEAVVVEVTAWGAAAKADVRVGDVVRATSAHTMVMDYPAANLLFGGVGRPRLAKILVPTSKLAFPKVLDAVRSNSQEAGGDGRVVFVLERHLGASPAVSLSLDGEDAAAAAAAAAAGQARDKVLVGASVGATSFDGFDARLFE